MHIAYYITGHGYGHAVRSAAIINELSPATEITVCTAVPEAFFLEELRRPCAYRSTQFDCGCLQYDSVSVDIQKTLRFYRQLATANRSLLGDEVAWCHDAAIDGIAADITPFALDVAAAAALPSVAVTNFTWFDIYQEYLSVVPEFKPYLDEMAAQYQKANRLLALSPALTMPYFSNQKQVPVVGRRGNNQRGAVADYYGIDPKKRVALIYIGDFGMERGAWERLETFSDWEFIGLHPIAGASKNYHLIKKGRFPYEDLVASVDAVVSKLGYGVVSECFINGTPLLYLPRQQFAEYPVLERAVKAWGGGVLVSAEEFYQLHWEDGLRRLSAMRPVHPMSTNGAQVCARSIEQLLSTGGYD